LQNDERAPSREDAFLSGSSGLEAVHSFSQADNPSDVQDMFNAAGAHPKCIGTLIQTWGS